MVTLLSTVRRVKHLLMAGKKLFHVRHSFQSYACQHSSKKLVCGPDMVQYVRTILLTNILNSLFYLSLGV